MKNKKTQAPDQALEVGKPESYLAPPPPKKGKIIGIDCHPDIFTAAVYQGTCLQNAGLLHKGEDFFELSFVINRAKLFTRQTTWSFAVSGTVIRGSLQRVERDASESS